MLDIKFIRQNPDIVKEGCAKKHVKPEIVDQLLAVDHTRRQQLNNLEQMRAQKNEASKTIVEAKNQEEKKAIIAKMQQIDQKSDLLSQELKKSEEEFIALLYSIPNLPLTDVPIGRDESENKIVRKWGDLPKFDFTPKDHSALAEKLGIIDVQNAARITGTRFAYLKGAAALLEFALVHYAFDVLGSSRILKKIAAGIGKNYSDKLFIPVVPPIMIRPDVFSKMARLSQDDKNEKYYLPQDDLYLIGSAEHTLGPLHMDEIIAEKDLPKRYVGFSASLRREAGSYGKDTKGILRMHQFDKVEMESFTSPETSLREQEFFVAIQEYLMQSLEIPYQVVMVCTGDMGAPDARQIDIESWMPGQNRYRETHSADLMTDYQARRLNTRMRRTADAKIDYAHMNDATVFAIGRTLVAILENYQQKDGSVKIPKALQKYLSFKEIK